MSYIPIELKVLARKDIQEGKVYLKVNTYSGTIERIVKVTKISPPPVASMQIELFTIKTIEDYRDYIPKGKPDCYAKGYGVGWGFRYVV